MTDEERAAQAYAITVAWHLGFAAGERALAVRREAMWATWQAAPRLSWEQQVQRRIAEAEALAAAAGRDEYRGGYVSWDDEADWAVAA